MFFIIPHGVRAVFRTWTKVLVADVVLLVGVFYLLGDIDWRAAYASSIHAACAHVCRYTPSFAYGPLTYQFTMSGNGVHLTSPPTFDWLQVFVLLLLAINIWFGYTILARRRAARADAA